MSRLLVVIVLFVSTLLWAQSPTTASTSRSQSFKIAESAFINSDLFKAEYLFKNLIKDNVWDDEAFNSLDRLVTIAQMNGDKVLFSDMINTVKNIGDSSNVAYYSLLYNIGK